MIRRAIVLLPAIVDDGASRFNLDLVAALRELGIDASIFTVKPRPSAEMAWSGHADGLVQEGLAPGTRLRYAYPRMVAGLLAAAGSADVVVGGDFGEALVGAYLAGRATGTPVIGQIHADPLTVLDSAKTYGWTSDRAVSASHRVCRRLDALVTVTEELVPRITELGLAPERTQVIHTAIDASRVREECAAPPPDWLPDGPFVVSAGRLAHEKGFDLLIRAHAGAREHHHHRLVILGDGPERGALEALATELGVRDTVFLPGFMSNPFPVVSRASVFCQPSRSETYSLVVQEALAIGVPVIAARTPLGPAAVLGYGRFGELVPPESPAALATALEQHFRDPEPLRQKAQWAAEVADTLTLEARAREYVRLFEEVGERRAVRPCRTAPGTPPTQPHPDSQEG